MSIRTYKYKLYRTKRVKHLHDVVNISGIIYNHCIALHKRYYKLYRKSLNKFQLQKHRYYVANAQNSKNKLLTLPTP